MENRKLKIICYLPILAGLPFVRDYGLAHAMAGFVSLIVGLIIMIKARDISEFKQLSLHQFWGIMAAEILVSVLFFIIENTHFLSVLAAIAFIIIWTVVFIVQFLVDLLISKCFKRDRK